MEAMALDPTFWGERRVFLTGHTGFKGGWLVAWLHALGARVSGYALPAETSPSLWQSARLEGCLERHELADIRDAQTLRQALERSGAEIVLHLAAQPLVRRSYQAPAETYATNVMGTVNLLEAVRQVDGVRAVVVVTTDKSYENREWAWPYRETDRLGGHDPYSNSKACAELVCAAYRDSFLAARGVGLATARAGNVIGGGDWSPDRLLPDLFRAWTRGERVALRYPQATRPWQHVLEPLAGYLLLAQSLAMNGRDFGAAWNFGPLPDSVQSVETVVRRLAARWPEPVAWTVTPEAQPHEAGVLALDSSLARQRLGWQPRWSLDEALAQTVAWQAAWAAGQDMRQVTLDQINLYQGLDNE